MTQGVLFESIHVLEEDHPSSGMQTVALEEGFVSLRRVFDRLPDATFVVDPRGRVLDLNAAAATALSSTRGRLLGSTLHDIGAAPVLISRFEHGLREALRDGMPYYGMLKLEDSDGVRQWEVDLHPDPKGGDGVPCVLIVARDVTLARRREDALRGRNRALSQLGDSLCHDLRSPLATIRAFVGFLALDLKERNELQIVKDVESIHNAVDRMTELIAAIVRRAGPNARVTPVDVPLADVVGDALALLAGPVASCNAEIHVTEAPWMLRGERESLVQIFENLIENALKYARLGERPSVTIGVEEKQGAIMIFVRDQGIGVDAGNLHRVFNRFERLGAGTEGTGMGLSLVKRLVERHGGKVWLESAGEGRGTTVRLTLAGTHRQALKVD